MLIDITIRASLMCRSGRVGSAGSFGHFTFRRTLAPRPRMQMRPVWLCSPRTKRSATSRWEQSRAAVQLQRPCSRCSSRGRLTTRRPLDSQVLKNQAMLASLGITTLVQEHRRQLPAEKKAKDKLADSTAPGSAPTRASARVAAMPDRPQYAPEVRPQRQECVGEGGLRDLGWPLV